MSRQSRFAALVAAWLTAAFTLVSCGGSGPDGDAATRPLRSVAPEDLLNRVALHDDLCTLFPPVTEEEGALEGNSAHGGQTFFAGEGGGPGASNVHVAIDRFPNVAQSSEAAKAAAPDVVTMLGQGTREADPLPGWPGSRTFTRSLTDFTGQRRVAFAAVVPAGRDVVRINSLGLPTVTTEARFRDLATGLLDGLTGRVGVRRVPACS